MADRKKLVPGLLMLGAAIALAWTYFHWHQSDPQSAREDLLSHLPADSTSVAYVDFQELRASAFLSQILSWAPRPQTEEEYAKFVQATGFDYERDLDRVGFSFSGSAQSPKTMVVAEGRFDRKKIEAYSAHFGTLKTANGKTIYAVRLSNPPRTAYFTFLRDDRMAICNDASCFFQASGSSTNSEEWREHFLRLAGTPLFVVMRQDSQLLSELSQRTPGGYRSPQLATLLGQLQWISMGAKPEGVQLRVVADGETSNETLVRQLNDMLSGLLILAQAGLDDPKSRKQLDPKLHDAYAGLLKSAEVQKLDRGTSKSVRLIFEITPQLLELGKSASTAEPAEKEPAIPAGRKRR
ncbi:MAG TPA: hypothetical protein VNH19_23500 [Candidatus Limnocylindrales bacterium]|nr:hypothetical protein [Candidatus Limnocylindrales bacterium]HXJ15249.1 hypothetical protein [Candidatus Limnocylindrales bacterium]